MHNKTNYGGLDRFRILAALLVVAIHTSPLTSISEGADFYLTRILARIAVPFFFMVTGQFVAAGLLKPSGKPGRYRKFLLKTALLYAFCILLYLPIGIYAGHYKELTVFSALRMVVFDGTFYHLWYFPACILGMLVVRLMSRFLSLQGMTIVSAVLYVIGLFGDSYYGLAEKVPALKEAYEFSFQICSYTRNGLFFAPLFLVLGMRMAAMEKKKRPPVPPLPLYIGLAVSFGLLTAEGFLLRHFELQRHDSMYIALVPTMFFLYQCLLCPPLKSARHLRSMSMWIYVLHPAFIVVVRAVAKPLKLTTLLVENSLVHYLAVALLSVAAGLFMTIVLARLHTAFPGKARTETVRKEAARKKPASRKKARPVSIEAEEQEENGFTDLSFQEEEDLIDLALPDESFSYEEDSMDFTSQEDSDWQEDDWQGTRHMPESAGQKRQPPRDMNPHREPEEETSLPPDNTPWESTITGGKTSPASRAWIELDKAALEQNVDFLRSRLPEHCRLMPAVKAEAYGHGAVLMSQQLSRLGVDAFCVACASEGIELREAGIQGEILILGYTSPEDFPLLCDYQLTQTVIDYPYAQELNRFGQEIHVHIGIDTGMHRVGIRCEKIEDIAAVCQMQNLAVDGIFTHLCVSDSPHPDHRSFTQSQIHAFYQVVDILQEQGFPCHGQHILASYGILNLLPDRAWHEGRPVPPVGNRGGLDSVRLAADYVRPGIVLYGVLGTQTDLDVWKDFLRPVLSLKAKVASIRPLYAGESVGYGITYTAEKNMRIAAITIGYGDGLPRELSNGKGSVLIHGHRAPIVGRICMDQTMVDISNIPDVHAGDTAVVIGSSGTLEITVGQIAEQCGTITHEILTGLASRLDRIWS